MANNAIKKLVDEIHATEQAAKEAHTAQVTHTAAMNEAIRRQQDLEKKRRDLSRVLHKHLYEGLSVEEARALVETEQSAPTVYQPAIYNGTIRVGGLVASPITNDVNCRANTSSAIAARTCTVETTAASGHIRC